LNATPHVAVADDIGLLNALPIAAAVIERTEKGALRVAAHNSRFVEAVEQSNCTALDWNDADCLKGGPIAELLQNFFEGADESGELDFKYGSLLCRGRADPCRDVSSASSTAPSKFRPSARFGRRCYATALPAFRTGSHSPKRSRTLARM
jgi:hypothetical protein